ncbi:MAG: PD-(D/E)XK nuclease family protein [Acidimicrobiales bacterium]
MRPADREAFKRCRRQWDFSAARRGGYEPVASERPVDFGRAVRDALAVYYFPGMWEWNRAIVRPLAHDGFRRSLQAQGAAGDDEAALVERGTALLDRYFDWAPGVDDFVPVRVETDFDVNVPDPAQPDRHLATPSGEPIHYQGRIDLLAVDADDNYWIVDHRVVDDDWTDLDLLLLEERSSSFCWAWELFFLGMKIAGVIYNEVRAGGTAVVSGAVGPAAVRTGHRRMYVQGGPVPSDVLTVEGGDFARRTRVPRGDGELGRLRAQLAAEAQDMTAADVRIYPNPSLAHCGACDYRPPCVAANAAGSAGAVLSESYRKRPPEVLEEGRLGGVTWAMGRGAAPPKFSRDRSSEVDKDTTEEGMNK